MQLSWIVFRQTLLQKTTKWYWPGELTVSTSPAGCPKHVEIKGGGKEGRALSCHQIGHTALNLQTLHHKTDIGGLWTLQEMWPCKVLLVVLYQLYFHWLNHLLHEYRIIKIREQIILESCPTEKLTNACGAEVVQLTVTLWSTSCGGWLCEAGGEGGGEEGDWRARQRHTQCD